MTPDMECENLSLSWTIRHLLYLTMGKSDADLLKMWRSGELPTGILDFIIACHKADNIFVNKQKDSTEEILA